VTIDEEKAGRSTMKTTLALLTASVLAGGAIACGSTSGGAGLGSRTSSNAASTSGGAAGTISRSQSPTSYWESDGDGDADEQEKGPSTDDRGGMVATGYGARRADRQAITAVVKSYYAAATAGDGTRGCSLLSSSLATSIAEGEDQSGPSGARTCAASLSPLFKEQHQRLTAEDFTTMVVTGVHVNGTAALATLGFKAMPESEIVLQREGRTWKIDALFDSTLP
jgi:hypothetical protein